MSFIEIALAVALGNYIFYFAKPFPMESGQLWTLLKWVVRKVRQGIGV